METSDQQEVVDFHDGRSRAIKPGDDIWYLSADRILPGRVQQVFERSNGDLFFTLVGDQTSSRPAFTIRERSLVWEVAPTPEDSNARS